MNEPINKPVAPRASLGLSRRPFAAVARISLLAVLVAILGACGGAQQGAGNPASPPERPATEEQAAIDNEEGRGETEAAAPATNDDELGAPVLGDEGAPVTMVEYADYQ